jgi:DNA-binding transcriptional ArsR family regulator
MQPMSKALYHPSREALYLPLVLTALSDPLRLQILLEVYGRGELSCQAFSFSIPKSTLSHHLKVLREAGIFRTRLQGTQRFVSLRLDDLEARFPSLIPATLAAAQQFLEKSPFPALESETEL